MKNVNDVRDKDIAIIGMSGRFPGAENFRDFWKNISEELETITTFSEEELRASGIDEELITSPNYIRRRGIIGQAQHFDAAFFDITPRDAEIMDPQHRVFLECCWHAFEDAGYIPNTYPGNVGVFGGTGTAWHLNKAHNHPEVQKNTSGASIVTNNDKDYVTTRVSYKLNLKGPSVNVQTACSTAMVAVVMGVNSLLSGESDLVVAGGVSVDTPEKRGYSYMQGGMESADGRCYAFDARANGTVFSRGAGVVLLKRLKDAVADGDNIYAVVRGGAINNDGHFKAGFTAPSIDGQIEVARKALKNADVEAETISFVEAHGTATALGDPIEFTSLSQTFQETTEKRQYCRLGSVKTNIGHTDAASGVASLIKASMALNTGILPASLHFESSNPNIDFSESPFTIQAETSALPPSEHPHRALVNSFGVGGTNACVILEAPPLRANTDDADETLLFPLSAKTSSALEKMRSNLHRYLQENPEANLGDIAYTLQTGRSKFAFNSHIIAADREGLLKQLTQAVPPLQRDNRQRSSLVFMFPGQGNQYINMARQLYDVYPQFKESVDLCCEILKELLAIDLKDIIFQEVTSASASLINETRYTQPSLFVIEYSLAKLWLSWGIKPDIMLGHSVGEYVAACLSGVFTLHDALRAVAIRGRLVQALPAGSMLAVMLSEEALQPRLQGSQIEIAAANYPGLCVVAGEENAIAVFQDCLEQDNIFCKPLDTSHAFHSWMMEPMLEDFREVMSTITLSAPKIPFVSTLTGEWITAEQACDPEYWIEHVRKPVLFTHACQTLLNDDSRHYLFLEVGPGRSLESAVKQHLRHVQQPAVFCSLPSVRDVGQTVTTLLNSLGALWSYDIAIDWAAFYGAQQRRRVSLPGYPFERKEFTLPALRLSSAGAGSVSDHQALKRKEMDISNWFYMPSWKKTAPARYLPKVSAEATETCWLLFMDQQGIGEAVRRRLVAQGESVYRVYPGEQYRYEDNQFTLNADSRESYVELLQHIERLGQHPTNILFLWESDETTAATLESHSEGLTANSFYRPLYLQQALISENVLDGLKLLFTTRRVFSIHGETILQPQGALLTGNARVFYHEYPEVNCHLVDICDAMPTDTLAGLLIDELSLQTDGQLVALRGDQRWEEDYQSIPLPTLAESASVNVEDNGIYLITGGLGGLGMLVAEYVAEISNATLLLTYRSRLPAREDWQEWVTTHAVDDETSAKIAGILRLEDQGNKVHLLCVDICDAESMAEALAPFPHINGVFHTAGIAGGGIIPLKNDADCAAVIDPKVKGSLILDELLSERQPHFFILFSSITSIVGDVARIDYCSANAFMDAFAHYRNQHRSGHTVSLNWGKWGDVGMAARWTNNLIKKKKTTSIESDEAAKGTLLIREEKQGNASIFTINLSVNHDWVIDEHQLSSTPALVGTTLLNVLHEYISHFSEQRSLQVKNIMLTTPVIFHRHWPKTMRLVVTPETGGYHFTVQSRGIGDTAWQEHAFGQLRASEQAIDFTDLPQLKALCTQSYPITSMSHGLDNANSDEIFLTLSRRWDNQRAIYRHDNLWLVHNQLADSFVDDLNHWAFHPALVDSTSISCLIPLTEDNYLPISYGKVTFHQPIPAESYAGVRLRQPYQSGDGMIVMDIVFYDAQGIRLLTLEGYTLIRMTADNQVSGPHASAATDVVKVNPSDKDILYYEGREALKRQLSHPHLPQLVVVTSNLPHLVYEAIPERTVDLNHESESSSDAHTRPALLTEFVAPENEIEVEIAKIWQSILGISGIGVHDSFTELGGNSLLAVQVVSMVSTALETDIRVDLFYQNQTIRGMADLIVFELEAVLENS
ncbi:type I polyketide synthase [Rosenbergiella collisarenosi]|uniref:type I polyketide synthase n=1 Tax=Rosenbergiella collisarenosi TaxID=1544695 RepID=UPI001F50213B|nr:type I polyketide synthase [Rosenbergiella collisarenosi]